MKIRELAVKFSKALHSHGRMAAEIKADLLQAWEIGGVDRYLRRGDQIEVWAAYIHSSSVQDAKKSARAAAKEKAQLELSQREAERDLVSAQLCGADEEVERAAEAVWMSTAKAHWRDLMERGSAWLTQAEKARAWQEHLRDVYVMFTANGKAKRCSIFVPSSVLFYLTISTSFGFLMPPCYFCSAR